MTPPPRPFRLVYRFEFNDTKSDEVLEGRGFDLGHATRIFPGYVLERRDTRDYREPRFQVIGDCLGDLLFVVYTRRGLACRLITARFADPFYMELWHDHTH